MTVAVGQDHLRDRAAGPDRDLLRRHQFHAGLRRRDQPDSGQPDETELSLSLNDLKVRSPVLGVIILTISLAFFYLYLVHVYPIRNVF